MLTQKQIEQYRNALSDTDKQSLLKITGTDNEFNNNNASNFYQQAGVENPYSPSSTAKKSTNQAVNFFDNTIGKAGDFLLRNIVGAPVRAVGTMWADVYKNFTGKSVNINTPFGRIKSLDKLEDTAGLLADAAATAAGAVSGTVKVPGITNKVAQKVVESTATVGRDTLIGAVQGAAAGYAEEGNLNDAKRGAIMGAITSGVLSVGTQAISNIATVMKNHWTSSKNKAATSVLDNTIEWYDNTKIGTSPEAINRFKQKRGLEYSLYALGGDTIDSVSSWQNANSKYVNVVDNYWNKLVQSADDAGTILTPSKVSADDIINISKAPNVLEVTEVPRFNELTEKLQNGIITIKEGDELVSLLNRAYETASPSAQRITESLKNDVVDTTAKYWQNQGFSPDMVKNVRDTRAALIETKEVLKEIAPLSEKINAAIRQGKTNEAMSLIDDLYSAGVGIKSKVRIGLTLIKQMKEAAKAGKSIDEIIAKSFTNLNNNALKNEMIARVKDFQATVPELDIEVQPKGKTVNGAEAFEQERIKYGKDISAGKFKEPTVTKETIAGTKPTPEVAELTPETVITPETTPVGAPVVKADVYKQVYKNFSKKQLQSQYNSLNKQFATMVRKQKANEYAADIEAIKEQIDVIESLIEGAK